MDHGYRLSGIVSDAWANGYVYVKSAYIADYLREHYRNYVQVQFDKEENVYIIKPRKDGEKWRVRY